MSKGFKFLAEISEDEVAAILEDTQWEEDVAKAAFFGATTTKKPGYSFDDMVLEIINYNVAKRIRGLLLSKVKMPLPKVVSLDDSLEAFEFLEELTIYASLLKADEKLSKPFKSVIKTTNTVIKDKLANWCESLQKEFSPISIQYKANKTKDTYTIIYS